MAVINRFPAGLLNLLDAKILGQNPNDLEAGIQGFLDVTPHYEASCLQTVVQETGSPSGVGGPYALLRVPAGEIWIPITVSARITGSGTADTAARFNLVALLNQSVSVALATWNTAPQTVAVGTQLSMNWTPTRRLVCLPGTAFGTEISQTSSGSLVPQTEAWIVRVPG